MIASAFLVAPMVVLLSMGCLPREFSMGSVRNGVCWWYSGIAVCPVLFPFRGMVSGRLTGRWSWRP